MFKFTVYLIHNDIYRISILMTHCPSEIQNDLRLRSEFGKKYYNVVMHIVHWVHCPAWRFEKWRTTIDLLIKKSTKSFSCYILIMLILSLCIAPPHIKIKERTTTFFFFCKNLQLLAPFLLLVVVYTNCKRRQDMVYLTCLRFFQIPQATTIYNLDAQGHQTFGKQPPQPPSSSSFPLLYQQLKWN